MSDIDLKLKVRYPRRMSDGSFAALLQINPIAGKNLTAYLLFLPNIFTMSSFSYYKDLSLKEFLGHYKSPSAPSNHKDEPPSQFSSQLLTSGIVAQIVNPPIPSHPIAIPLQQRVSHSISVYSSENKTETLKLRFSPSNSLKDANENSSSQRISNSSSSAPIPILSQSQRPHSCHLLDHSKENQMQKFKQDLTDRLKEVAQKIDLKKDNEIDLSRESSLFPSNSLSPTYVEVSPDDKISSYGVQSLNSFAPTPQKQTLSRQISSSPPPSLNISLIDPAPLDKTSDLSTVEASIFEENRWQQEYQILTPYGTPNDDYLNHSSFPEE